MARFIRGEARYADLSHIGRSIKVVTGKRATYETTDKREMDRIYSAFVSNEPIEHEGLGICIVVEVQECKGIEGSYWFRYTVETHGAIA